MTIRPATPQDWPAITALLASSHLPLAGAGTAHFLVAAGEAVVGTAAVEIHGDHGLLRSVAVAESHRGQGIATRLTEALIAEARARGLASLTLLTTTAEDYFPRFGFTRIDRAAAPEALRESAEFRGACPASAVVLTLALPPHPRPKQ